MKKNMTKTQVKRAYASIQQKTRKLWSNPEGGTPVMSTKDMIAITAIIRKYQKKM